MKLTIAVAAVAVAIAIAGCAPMTPSERRAVGAVGNAMQTYGRALERNRVRTQICNTRKTVTGWQTICN